VRSILLRVISLFLKFRVSLSAIDYAILHLIRLSEALSKRKLLKIWRDLSSLKKEILIYLIYVIKYDIYLTIFLTSHILSM